MDHFGVDYLLLVSRWQDGEAVPQKELGRLSSKHLLHLENVARLALDRLYEGDGGLYGLVVPVD